MRSVVICARAIKGVVRFSSSAFIVVAAFLVIIMMLMTVVDVSGRFALNKPLIGVIELSDVAVALAAFLGLSYVMKEDRHVSIDVLFPYFPLKMQKVVQSFILLLSLVLFGLITWQLARQGIRIAQQGQTTSILKIPLSPFYFVAAIGSLIMCLELLVELVESVTEVTKVLSKSSLGKAKLPGGAAL